MFKFDNDLFNSINEGKYNDSEKLEELFLNISKNSNRYTCHNYRDVEIKFSYNISAAKKIKINITDYNNNITNCELDNSKNINTIFTCFSYLESNHVKKIDINISHNEEYYNDDYNKLIYNYLEESIFVYTSMLDIRNKTLLNNNYTENIIEIDDNSYNYKDLMNININTILIIKHFAILHVIFMIFIGEEKELNKENFKLLQIFIDKYKNKIKEIYSNEKL